MTTDSPPTHPRPHILVVEDHAETRYFLELALGESYAVDSAINATEALEMAPGAGYDLFLIDIWLRDVIDGVELMHRLREEPGYAQVPMVAMTAVRKAESSDEYRKAGFDAFLRKPFFPESLLEVIRGLLDESGGSAEPTREQPPL